MRRDDTHSVERRTLAARLLAASVICLSLSSVAKDPRYEEGAIVHVQSWMGAGDGSPRRGAGFIFGSVGGRPRIATAYHLIVGAYRFTVTDARDRPMTAPRIEEYDEAKDLAVLSADAPAGPLPVLLLGDAKGLIGKSGLAVGHPGGKSSWPFEATFPKGEPVTSGSWLVHGRHVFRRNDIVLVPFVAVVDEGMSGGPLVVDGRAIGVICGAETQSGQGPGWAVSAHYLENGGLKRVPSGQVCSASALPPLSLLDVKASATLLKSDLPVSLVSDEVLGLTKGRRVGGTSLQATLAVTFGDTQLLCPGESVELKVRTSAPAFVRIYSVSCDGRVLLADNPDQPVDGVVVVSKATNAFDIGQGSYGLVLVAVPAVGDVAQAFGDVALRRRKCLTPPGTTLAATQFPSTAALHAVTYAFDSFDNKRCQPNPETQAWHKAKVDALLALPSCDAP